MIEKESRCAKIEFGEPLFTPGAHHFAHSAMATLFEIYCAHPDAGYAGQAARAAFELLDRLELELSRFIENSDISRINSLEPGQCTGVSPWTLECLQMALRMYSETGKVFDVSVGSGLESLELSPEDMTVGASSAAVQLDLGGIGKGYAVDRMAEVLEEWDITQALLHGGFSSVLALEPPHNRDGWLLTLSLPGSADSEVFARVSARQCAFSASGIRKGEHIIDPRDGRPVQRRLGAWASLPRAARQSRERVVEMDGDARTEHSAATITEAWSTAFMILTAAEVSASCDAWPGLEAWLIDDRPGGGSNVTNLLHLPGS
jgi:thiamine biosynthesis lipoprotein